MAKNHKLSSLEQEKYLPKFLGATSLKWGCLQTVLPQKPGGGLFLVSASFWGNAPSDPHLIVHCNSLRPTYLSVSSKDASHMQSELTLRSSYFKEIYKDTISKLRILG